MTRPTTFRLRRLAPPRRHTAPRRGGRWAAALLLRVGCAALLAWIGYIHLHLWLEGYRHIPTNGPLFLLDAVAGFALAAVLLAWPRPLAGLLAAGYTAATLGALLISLSVGLFGFRESISASYVTESLAIETITVLALLGWTVLAAAIAAGGHAARARAIHGGAGVHLLWRARVRDRVEPAARHRPAGQRGNDHRVPAPLDPGDHRRPSGGRWTCLLQRPANTAPLVDLRFGAGTTGYV